MEIGKKYLPIGTVVLIKGGKKELMITSYCIFPTGKLYDHGQELDPKGKVYDYGACTYPEGILISDQIFAFNHDQIEKVCHMGYQTDEHNAFTKMLTLTIDDVQNEIKSGDFEKKYSETQDEQVEGQA